MHSLETPVKSIVSEEMKRAVYKNTLQCRNKISCCTLNNSSITAFYYPQAK